MSSATKSVGPVDDPRGDARGRRSPLTREQQAALAARDRSVSLSAGAGCGKTFVLTERFLAEVAPDAASANLSEVVAITFTDAAAREMRDRIRRRCFQRMQEAVEPASRQAWRRLMRSIDGARLSTIHSFCTSILRRFAVEAGLDPQFEVLDAPAAELLRLEAVDDLLRQRLIDGDEDALNLAAAYGLERLRVDLGRVCQPRSGEAIRRWRESGPEDVLSAWRRFHATSYASAATALIREDESLARLRRLCDEPLAAGDKVRRRLADVAETIDRLTAATLEEVPPLAQRLHELARVDDLRAAGEWAGEEAKNAFKEGCKKVREAVKKRSPKPFDEAASRQAAERGLALVRLAAGVVDSIEERKRRRSQLEFDDLLIRCRDLLEDPRHDAVRRTLAAESRLIMVDEFQDTNPLQLAVVRAVCGPQWQEQGLFVVGDFKQSIYRFNGAEPQVSVDLESQLPPAGRLALTTNFRSQPGVIDFVNALFCEEFRNYRPLQPARKQATRGPCVEFLWTTAADADEDAADAVDPDEAAEQIAETVEPNVASNRRREARRIARRLRQLLESGEPLVGEKEADGERLRPLRPGDVAILFRSLSDLQSYEEALRQEGLDYYLAGGHAFYAQQEVFDVLNLLRAVDSAIDEISLAGALRSPLFGLADETLFWLVDCYGSLSAALASPPRQLPRQMAPHEADKVRRAAATLAQLRTAKDRLPVAELLNLAFRLTAYDAVVLAEFLGTRKAANLAKLVEQARQLDRTAPGDLHGFITQLAEFVARTPKEPLAAAQAEGDVIRLMSIHYAKGLEFPLVVLPDLERKRQGARADAGVELPLGPLLPRLEDEEKSGVTGVEMRRLVEDQADLEERVRLLYVGCTRAADYLILSSSVKDPAKPKQDWLRLVARRFDLADGSLVRPLPAGLSAPLIRTSADVPEAQQDGDERSTGVNLLELVEELRAVDAVDAGPTTTGADPLPVRCAERRRFTFSRLSGILAADSRQAIVDEEAGPAGEADADSAEFAEPAEDDDGSARGRQLGVVVHAALERIDFRRPPRIGPLCRSLAEQMGGGDVPPLAETATEMIERFLESPRGRALAGARVVRREVDFLLPWPPQFEANSATTSIARRTPTDRYLYGVVDCLYQDDEGVWRLLDYKTNRLGRGGVPELASSYELQLASYSLACEGALGAPLGQCALISLSSGQEWSYAWSRDDLQAAVQRITAAMDRLGG